MQQLVGYVRRSRERANGYGLADQRRQIEQWASYRGVRLVAITEDNDVSGAVRPEERSAFALALSMIDAGEAEGVAVAKFDRVSRSVQDFSRLLDRSVAEGWSLVCLDPEIDTTTSTGRAFAQMLSVFAELERAQFAERMRGGWRAKQVAGGWVGGIPPYGWRAEGGALVKDESEQAVRRRIQRMRRRGLSLRAIGAELDRAGVATRRGGQWHANAVARALRRA